MTVPVRVEDAGAPTSLGSDAEVLRLAGAEIPVIPAVVDAWDGSSLLSLWRYSVSRQGRDASPLQQQAEQGKQG